MSIWDVISRNYLRNVVFPKPLREVNRVDVDVTSTEDYVYTPKSNVSYVLEVYVDGDVLSSFDGTSASNGFILKRGYHAYYLEAGVKPRFRAVTGTVHIWIRELV